MAKLGLEHGSPETQPACFPLSLYFEELFLQIPTATFSRLEGCVYVVSQWRDKHWGRGVCVCVCVCVCVIIHSLKHTFMHTRNSLGMEAPFTQDPGNALEQEAGAGSRPTASVGFGGLLFAVCINLGLLQRPKLGSHLRSQALTFKKLQSK